MKKIDEVSIGLAKRLRLLRKAKKLSNMKLSGILTERGCDISKDSLQAYEVDTLNHTKARKNMGMRVENLYHLADFYGVSVDYLLGLTEDPSQIKTTVDDLGLTPTAAQQLKNIRYGTLPMMRYPEKNSSIMEKDELWDLFYLLHEWRGADIAERTYSSISQGSGQFMSYTEIADTLDTIAEEEYAETDGDTCAALRSKAAALRSEGGSLLDIPLADIYLVKAHRQLDKLIDSIRKEMISDGIDP